jgi:hypothetical protein
VQDKATLFDSLRLRLWTFCAFMPTAERGVFHEAPPTADQSTLYFIETDLKLKRSFEVFLLTEQPPPEDW